MFKLAGHLHMSVARAQREISCREFNYWQAVHAIEPIGPERRDAVIQILCDLMAQVHGDRHSSPKKYAPQWVEAQMSEESIGQELTAILGPPHRREQ